MIRTIAASGLGVMVYMTGVYLLALILKDNSIVDVAWGPGFILVAVISLIRNPLFAPRQALILALVVMWGMRLATHILVRRAGQGEDFRYAQWRRNWGRWFVVRSYIQVFLLQGVFLMIIASPIIMVGFAPGVRLGVRDGLGAAVWLMGYIFEVVGDFQLERFKRGGKNKGRIMTSGLWRYTRHPNYFGEAAMWWGIFFIALSVPKGWTGFISPLLITFLLLKVSGVPMLEKRYAGNPEFAAYARRTSVFIPWFPKRSRETRGPEIPSR
jgi:steroid 5-alpha reductase family enzyme